MSKVYQMHQEQIVSEEIEVVFNFFKQADNLKKLTPPWLNLEIFKAPQEIQKNSVIELKVKVRGITLPWITRITEYDPPNKFIDIQEKGPYKKWEHHHLFEKVPGGTKIIDTFYYSLPFGILGQFANYIFVKRDLEKVFHFRKKIIKNLFS